jgi:outer membrane protein
MKTRSQNDCSAMSRYLATPALAACFMLFTVLAAAAQTPAPAQQTNPQTPQQQDAQNPPLSRPIPERTIGLEPGKVVSWTMRDAILAALDKNVDIEIEREKVRLAQWDLLAAQGVYDPVTSSTFSYNSATQANTRFFTGTTSATTFSKNLNYNFGFEQLLGPTGGAYEINFNNNRNVNNTGLFSPQYSPQLVFSITQPIFKNLKIDQNRRQIRIRRKQLDLSDAEFRQRAIEIISSVQRAYWDLALSIKNENIAREAVRLADKQVQDNQRQVEVGTKAPIDVIEAATQLETRRTDVFQAMNAVAQAENALKALTVDGPNSDLWTAKIDPVENFEIQPVTLPLEDAYKLAIANRPEVKQLGLQKEINQVDIDFFRNQAKPQIDFIASYNMNGVSGTKNPNNPSAVNAPTCDPTLPPGTVCIPPNFLGGYGTALSTMFKNDFRFWSVGVNFSFPLRNRTAKANLARAREIDKQVELQNRKLLQDIEVEVRNAVQAVETARMRIESSRAARKYAQEQLDGEQKRFAAGLSTTFFVLQRQTDLSQAQFRENQALGDYNKLVAELQRVISTTLSSNNIEVKSDVQPVK